jgi:glycogen debranching enzyme
MAHRIALRARANQHFVYSGQSVLVTNLDGVVTGRGTEGFSVENTRLLCRDELTVNDRPLMTVSASPVGADRMLVYAEVPGGERVPRQAVYAETTRVVGSGMRTTHRFENYHVRDSAHFELALHFAADFADTDETQQGTRQQSAPVETMWDAAARELRFRYEHPMLDRAVAIRIEGAPSAVRFDAGILFVTLELPPHTPVAFHVVVEPIFDGIRRATGDGHDRRIRCVRQSLRDEAPGLVTSNSTVTRAWQTAINDLASLPLGLPDGPAAPSAGLPLYQQFFGRDTLTIGWQAALAMPSILRDALRACAAMQGSEFNDWRDEEPGKIIHQAGTGPLAMLDINPFRRYYGDYSAPQDFLIMLGQYLAWTDDRDEARRFLPAARRVIDWLDRFGDRDGDGFLEYETHSAKGLKNQGWKDSDEAIVDERGAIVPNPIATSEMQAYWYVGLQQAALAFFLCGERRYALRLQRRARDLKERFHRAFWMEDARFYALALGPDKQQIRSIASNTGHCLAAGIVPRDRGPHVVRRMMDPDLFSGWGIRTLSSAHPAYNPFSYHLGSVWPVENGTIAFGFARYGRWEEFWRLAEGIFASTELFIGNRLPEALGGIPRDDQHAHPGIYPKSNEPQGWSASMIVSTIQALLGMRPIAPLGILLIDPHLPPWLPDLRLTGLHIGGNVLDLTFRRNRSGITHYHVRRVSGHCRVLRQPVPDGPRVTLPRRALWAIASLPRS